MQTSQTDIWVRRASDCIRRRDFAGALPACQRALAERPDDRRPLRLQGIALQSLGRHAEAADAFEQFLEHHPDDWQAWLRLAFCREMAGDPSGAAEGYRRILALRPDDADAHHNLARVLHGLGQLDGAERHYREALLLHQDSESLLGLAQVLYRNHRLAESRRCLEEAMALDPGNRQVLQMLANLLADLDEDDEAEDLHRRLLQLDPADVDSYAGLVELGRIRPGDPDHRRLLQIRDRGDTLPAEARVQIEYTLGRLHDRARDHAQAFEYFQRGARLQRERIEYDHADRIRQLDAYRRFFTRELFERRRGAGCPSRLPVFIVGMPRSGSTLVEQILASHPEVHGGDELEFLPDLASAIRAEQANSTFPDCLADLGPEALTRHGESYVDQLRRLDESASRITDKMLSNYMLVGLIQLILPESAIIYCSRDPVATCFSCFTHLFAFGNHYTYDFDELAAFYRIHEQYMAHWRDVLPEGRILTVRYEDVVNDVESQARRIVACCGLDWDDRCLRFHQTDRAVHTLSSKQVRQPLYTSSLERWRAYEPHLGPLLEALDRHGVGGR